MDCAGISTGSWRLRLTSLRPFFRRAGQDAYGLSSQGPGSVRGTSSIRIGQTGPRCRRDTRLRFGKPFLQDVPSPNGNFAVAVPKEEPDYPRCHCHLNLMFPISLKMERWNKIIGSEAQIPG